jgi:hypothetical protein
LHAAIVWKTRQYNINLASQFSRMLRYCGAEGGKVHGFRRIEIVDDHGKPGSGQALRDP